MSGPSVYQQSGAVEACWAHNPEVRGSQPRSAKYFNFFFRLFLYIVSLIGISYLFRGLQIETNYHIICIYACINFTFSPRFDLSLATIVQVKVVWFVHRHMLS